MKMPEYYLTDCEKEIFVNQKKVIALDLVEDDECVDIIEFGCGDGFKTKTILSHLSKINKPYNFIPIDISSHALEELVTTLEKDIPDISVQPKKGDYFHMMEEISQSSPNRKVVLFLGANIGNYSPKEADDFMGRIQALTLKGDKLLIGFDLIKSPGIIYNAYSDPHGHTKNFNLNYLVRMNRELNADFNIENFEHHTEYNPITGAVKSYLVSTRDQTVYIKSFNQHISFLAWEPIFMELSQKYNHEMIERLAKSHGFDIIHNYKDTKNYFVDSLWLKAH
jgi:dimethylhistidine N-methyltransferase